MVGGMPRRCHGFYRPTVARDYFTVSQRYVGPKIAIRAGIERVVLTDMQGPCGPVRTLGIDRSPGRLFDGRHSRRMIPMGMGHKNMRNGFVPRGTKQSADVSGIVRSRIENRNLSAPDEVADGPLEREWAGIVGHDPTHTRHRLVHRVGG